MSVFLLRKSSEIRKSSERKEDGKNFKEFELKLTLTPDTFFCHSERVVWVGEGNFLDGNK